MFLELLPLVAPLPIPLLAVAVLSGAETALFTLTYHDRLRLARSHPLAAAQIGYLLARPRGLLVLILFLNMLASTVYFVLTSLALLQATQPWVAVVIGVVNLLLMTLAGEVVSKMLAARYAVPISRVIAGPLRAVYRVLRPVVEFVEAGVIAPLARLFSPGVASGELTPDELGALLHLGAQEGAIDADEQRVLGQVIGLSGLRVREVMTPRVDLSWLEASAPLAEVQEMARVQGLTRIPICRGSIDDEDVLGLLDVKKYLAAAAAGKPVGLEECVDPPCYAPERASLDKLLELMRTRGVKLAICVNEHGSVTGVVSLQDLVRRLVAELDRQDEESIAGGQVRQVGAGEWEVPGRLSVGAWAGMFGLKADKRVSTVAGLIFARLGRTPEVGDSVVIGNVRLRVARLDGRVVESAFVDLVTDGALAGGGA